MHSSISFKKPKKENIIIIVSQKIVGWGFYGSAGGGVGVVQTGVPHSDGGVVYMDMADDRERENSSLWISQTINSCC